MIYRLDPRIRHYAWGSHSELAALRGHPAPTTEPEAELWMGAHEDAPAGVEVEGQVTTLDRLIAGDPIGMLGETTVTQFQRRLPFLLKVLAPEKALSIQCHPSREEALTAPTGTYADNWPKPEAWLTLTEFEVFVGTHSMDQVRSIAMDLACPAFDKLVLEAADGGVQQLLSSLLHADSTTADELTDAVVAACAGRDDNPHLSAIHRVSQQFPRDRGLAVLLVMQHHVVPAGRYLFLPAGVLHAAVKGVTLEILANSDNVVRAGLTPKTINIGELLRIVDVERSIVAEQVDQEARVHSFPVDVAYFQLHQVNPGEDPVDLPGAHKPRIVFNLAGSVVLQDGSDDLLLHPAQSCFIPASTDRVTCRGEGTVYVATTGLVG